MKIMRSLTAKTLFIALIISFGAWIVTDWFNNRTVRIAFETQLESSLSDEALGYRFRFG
jgi:hypothetical protein